MAIGIFLAGLAIGVLAGLQIRIGADRGRLNEYEDVLLEFVERVDHGKPKSVHTYRRASRALCGGTRPRKRNRESS